MAEDYPQNIKDVFEEMLLGKEGVAEKRRAGELEHERELAKIRRESHALIWTGTAGELTDTIKQWYESGWLMAESLQDALQKASIHFAKPDGTPVLKPASIAPASQQSARFRALDESYQVIEFDGHQYELTPIQSTVIRVLHKAHLEKQGSVGIKEIQKALHINSGKMSGWFRKKNKALYEKLIVQTATRQHYRLDL
jgi:hypothetical protein